MEKLRQKLRSSESQIELRNARWGQRNGYDQIEKAQLQIKADLPSPETILAVVYETGSKYRELDEVLSDLEKRRRRILEDYQNLQNARAIDLKAAE